MQEKCFSKWVRWSDREDLVGIKYPGVYVIAKSAEDISDKKFVWLENIIYIGMTRAILGLKNRLKQFDNEIIGNKGAGHGGADRVRYKYQNYDELVKELFVSVLFFQCNPKARQPADLRKMGDVLKFEYDCFAHYLETFKSEPEFNKRTSPKYSLTIARDKSG